MLDYTNCFINQIAVHHVGNKTNDEELNLSKSLLDIGGDSSEYLAVGRNPTEIITEKGYTKNQYPL